MQEPRTDDPRLGSLIQHYDPESTARGTSSQLCIGLLGYPTDEGVVRNGGRAGSKDGPTCLRHFLAKSGPLENCQYDSDISDVRIVDFGDVAQGELETMHERLTEAVHQILSLNFLPIVIGGGNDQSYRNFKALMEHLGNGRINVINVDAHLDVRPLIGAERKAHSGSPFRQLVMDPGFKGTYHVFAAQGSQCAGAHCRFVMEHGGHIYWLNHVQAVGTLAAFQKLMNMLDPKVPVFFSFDIDSISSADCPGVSCPAVVGLSAAEALDMCYEAGLRPNIRLVDFSELNPQVENYRSGRLLAAMIYHFIMGRRKLLRQIEANASS